MRPMKPREPGSPHEMLALTMGEAGGVEAVARFEGVSVFTLYKQLDPDAEPPSNFPVTRLSRLVRHFGARAPADYFAGLIGHRLVPIEKAMAAQTEMSALIAIAKECTDVLQHGYAALADGTLTVSEIAEWRRQIREAQQALAACDARLEMLLIERGAL